jgi:hypothetical protein
MTRISLSIELIWKIAREEAIGGDFEKIEPEHFMMALLRFSEFTQDEIGKLVPDQEVSKVLLNEIQSAQELLDKNRIDSTKLRRAIRQRMGKGTSPYQDGVMHRSDDSRQMFDKVALFAQDEGHDSLVAVIFLEYILSYPTPLMKEVLESLTGPVPKQDNTPLIDLYGTNLMNSSGVMDGKGILLHAQCTGFINTLRFSRKKLIFLIAPTYEETDALINGSLIKIKSDKNLSPDFNSTSFFGFKKMLSENFNETTFLSKVGEIIKEANTIEKAILIFPIFEILFKDINALENILESSLNAGPAKLVCPINEFMYKNIAGPGTILNSISESVWINQNTGCDIPWEI